jgi:hypothetical protein
MSNTNTTPPSLDDQMAVAMALAKRVQALSPDARDQLLAGLVGRMVVKDVVSLKSEIAGAEALDAEINTEAANDR